MNPQVQATTAVQNLTEGQRQAQTFWSTLPVALAAVTGFGLVTFPAGWRFIQAVQLLSATGTVAPGGTLQFWTNVSNNTPIPNNTDPCTVPFIDGQPTDVLVEVPGVGITVAVTWPGAAGTTVQVGVMHNKPNC